MSEAVTWPVEDRLKVLWGDMDAFAHVNNVRYFRWFEHIRIEYFKALDHGSLMSNEGVGPILAHSSCDFKAPVTFPDEVLVRAKVVKLGQKSITQHYEVVSQTTGALCATGIGIIVMMDYKKGVSIELEPSLRDKIQALEGLNPL